MNPDTPQSPRDELEMRLTALLLGQLTESEAEALRQAMSADPELQQLYDRLRQTISLVREAAMSPNDGNRPPIEQLTLSSERRDRLLASFKTVIPKELARRQQRRVQRRELALVAAMIVGLMLAAGLYFQNLKRWEASASLGRADLIAIRPEYDFGDANSPVPPASTSEPITKGKVLGFYAKETDRKSGVVGELVKAQAGDQVGLDDTVASVPAPASLPVESPAAGRVGMQGGSPPSASGFRSIPSRLARSAGGVEFSPDGTRLATQLSAGGFAGGGGGGRGRGGGDPAQKDGEAATVTAAASPTEAELAGETGLGRAVSESLARFDQSRAYIAETTPQALSGPASGPRVASAGAGAEQRRSQIVLPESRDEIAQQWDSAMPRELAPAKPSSTSGLGAVAAASDDRTIRLWSAATGQPAGEPIQNRSRVLHTDRDLRPDGQRFASVPGNAPTVGVGTDAPSFAFGVKADSKLEGIVEQTEVAPLPTAPAPSPAAQPVPVPLAGLPVADSGNALKSIEDRVSVGTFGNAPVASKPTAGIFKRAGLAETPAPVAAPAQQSDTDLAISEGVRRQAPRLDLESKLGEAKVPEKSGANTAGLPADARSLESRIGLLVGDPQAIDGVAKTPPIVSNPEGQADHFGAIRAEVSKSQLGDQVEFKTRAGTDSAGQAGQKQEPRFTKKQELEEFQSAPVADQLQRQDQPRDQLVETADRASQGRSTPPAQLMVIPEIMHSAVVTNAAHGFVSFDASVQPAQTLAGGLFYDNSAWREAKDKSLPKDAMVTIVDQAEPSSSRRPSIWGTIRGALTRETEATARVTVQKNLSDIDGLSAAAKGTTAFDPYFVQTESEKLRSKLVLNEVVEQLNLGETWAGRYGNGQALPKEETTRRLREMIDVRQEPKSGMMDIRVKGASSEESAQIANTVAKVYQEQHRQQVGRELAQLKQIAGRAESEKQELAKNIAVEDRTKLPEESDAPAPRKPAANAPVPQPEVATVEQPYSTFSLNVSDVSFKLAAASLDKGQLPDPATVRTEEFINAFDYRDPEPVGGQRLAFHWERARYPFAHNRDLVRLSVKTAASGRQAGRPLNVVLLLDNSGSMERADRQRIRQECLRVLAAQLQPQDRVSVVAFARTPRLWVDGLPGSQAGELAQRVGQLTPDGGTNLEEAMNLAYQTARRHFQANGINRVVLLTDGAANLGDVEPVSLKRSVESNRQQGVALDCFGLGWDGYNDDLLEVLSRNGDGRYGFINTPEAAATEFAGQLAGALRVAASDVKVQVQFNPRRVTAYRQMGYAKHQLTKEQFRDNTVDAAEIGAAEAGNALYVVEVNPNGEGPLGVARVRFKVPGTQDYREHEWTLAYDGSAKAFEQAAPSLRLAGVSAAFGEWLVASPFAAEVTPNGLLGYLGGVPKLSTADPRPKQLETMLRQAGSISGK